MEIYKLIIVGDSGVGKSNIMINYCHNVGLSEITSTIGVEFLNKNINIDGRNIKLQIWDTAGQERFRTITRSIFYRSRGALIVFDVTNKKSFNSVPSWYTELSMHIDVTKIPIALVGNKSDLCHNRTVSKKEANDLAVKYNMLYFETSAQDSTNIDDVFMYIGTTIIKYNDLFNLHENSHKSKITISGLMRNTHENTIKKGCC